MSIFKYYLLLSVLLLMACGKPKLLGDFSLTDEMISSVPYKGFEKLTYLEGQKKIVFDCEGRTREKHEVPGGVNTVDYYITEKDETKFSADGYDLFFTMSTSSYWYILPKLDIHWHDIKNELYGYASFIVPIDTNYLEDNQGYFRNFNVQGRTYDLVYYDSVKFDSSYFGLHKPAVFYYHKETGLIKIDFFEGNPWELKQIE